MKPTSPSLAACVTLGGSCLAWIVGGSLALVYFLDLPNSAVWMIAGTLGFSMTVAVTIILYEMIHAIDLPDYVDPAEFNGLLATDENACYHSPLPDPSRAFHVAG